MSASADIAMLERLTEAAFGFATAFADMARAEDDLDRKLTLFDAFHRSSASVRLSIGLKMRLAREAEAAARPERDEQPERLEQPEAPERPERYDERDRERDTERVSLPILLRTLERVAHDAETLLPQAAELPTLRELLARVKAEPETRPTVSGLRSRLAGSATTAVLTRPQSTAVIPVSPPGEDRDPVAPPPPQQARRRSDPPAAPALRGPGLGLPPKPG